MGIYLVTDCFSGNTYEVDFGSFEVNTSEVWSFLGADEALYCGTIGEVSESPEASYTGITQYIDCYDCFTGSGIGVLMLECNDLFGYTEDPTSFTTIPNIGDVYKFCSPFDPNECYCFSVVGFEAVEPIQAFFAGGPFVDCLRCENPARSANTENFICVPDCEFTGSTAVSPPHPVWTDGYGTAVTQLNMITLGGPNGLNA